MSEFSGYEKMPDNFKKLGLREGDFIEMEKLKWVVTEKVHGANFSFIYEEGKLKFAKRKEYLHWSDDFFGFQLVVNKLENNVLALFEQLSSDIPGTKFIIYGELFGGHYPHPQVAAEEGVYAIQTGVYYSPSIEFCAFDIAIETHGAASKYYLDYESAIRYFQQFEILHARPLFIGKLNEALNFNIRINSLVPKEFKLPELPENLIEGVVIKPFNQMNIKGMPARPILKHKNPEFEEEKKFHEAEKWSYLPNVSSKTEDLSFILDELKNYVTQNRLNSAISKIGTLDLKNNHRILEVKTEFLEDVVKSFNENNNNLLGALSPDEMEWISNRIMAEINKTVVATGT